MRVPVRVDVVLEHQVVFFVAHLHRGQEVAGLESRLEDESLVVLARGEVVRRWRDAGLAHLRLRRLHLLEVLRLTVDVVVPDQFLDVDQVGGDLPHRLRQIGIVNESVVLLRQLADILLAESAIDHVALCEHRGHVLLDVRGIQPQLRDIWLQVDFKRLARLAVPLSLRLAERLLVLVPASA